jgi:hypothetical protein
VIVGVNVEDLTALTDTDIMKGFDSDGALHVGRLFFAAEDLKERRRPIFWPRTVNAKVLRRLERFVSRCQIFFFFLRLATDSLPPFTHFFFVSSINFSTPLTRTTPSTYSPFLLVPEPRSGSQRKIFGN